MCDFRNFIDYVYDDIDDAYQYRPIKRYLRDATNPLEYYDDVAFTRRFRFTKDTVVIVLVPLLNLTQNVNNRGLPIPPLLQLLIALRFYATGNFQVSKRSYFTNTQAHFQISKTMQHFTFLYLLYCRLCVETFTN